jgi:photosystem II stability/assembly factor-like uncharacterized protein
LDQSNYLLRSLNGGENWTRIFDFGNMYQLGLTTARDGRYLLVQTENSGPPGMLYSNDAGKTFSVTQGASDVTTAKYINKTSSGDVIFGVVLQNQFPSESIGISVDSGKTFSALPVTLDIGDETILDIAFANATTWYAVTADLDGSGASAVAARKRAFRNRVLKGERGGVGSSGYVNSRIIKTIDGGQTWETVVATQNNILYDGIDCSPRDPNHCCVSTFNQNVELPTICTAARINCTTDGGQTWRFAYGNISNCFYVLYELQFADANTIFVVGDRIDDQDNPRGGALMSIDGGQTFTLQDDGDWGDISEFISSGSTPNGTLAFASVVDFENSLFRVLKYSA